MWTKYDFEVIEELHLDAAEDYRRGHPHRDLARTFLTTTHNLHDFHLSIMRFGGGHTTDAEKMQVLYLSRGIHGLFSIYWLVRHHCYTAGYGRVRFLLELYLVVRELNRDKQKTKEKWEEFREDIRENDYGPYEITPLTEYFSGKRQQLKGEFSKEEHYGRMYDRISNLGSHPHSLQSSYYDGRWSKLMEKDLLQLGLIFVYALSVQYIRTYFDTEFKVNV